MIRPLTTDDTFAALHEVVDHINNTKGAPSYVPNQDIPMLADLVRIVFAERGIVMSDEPLIWDRETRY